MQPVTRTSNWGYWDELDGKALVDGERIVVQWPDGSLTAEECRVEKGVHYYRDHGHDGTGPDDKAFLVVNVRGVEARIYLYESGVLCERGAFTEAVPTTAPTCSGAA